ncbi:hypothetical protein GC175_20450 [bacterium]|nr:hypothetical protein [bacterium]
MPKYFASHPVKDTPLSRGPPAQGPNPRRPYPHPDRASGRRRRCQSVVDSQRLNDRQLGGLRLLRKGDSPVYMQ